MDELIDILAMGLCAKTAIKNGGAGHGCWWELGTEAKEVFRIYAKEMLSRHGVTVGALNEIEALSDNCVNAERYGAEDALEDLQAIRRVIARSRSHLSQELTRKET